MGLSLCNMYMYKKHSMYICVKNKEAYNRLFRKHKMTFKIVVFMSRNTDLQVMIKHNKPITIGV